MQIIDQRKVLGKDFRIYGTIENPLFLARDVAEWIEYEGRTGQMLSTIDDAEKLTHTVYASGQNREMWFLTEDGLYEVLMQSRKPIAKQFKTKVKEILKDIRIHGLYATPETLMAILSDPNAMITILSEYRDEKERRLLAEKKIEEQKPLVSFTQTVLKSKDNILVRQLSKIAQDEGMDIGEKKLYRKMREWGMILNKSTEPAQKYMNFGLFVVDEKPKDTPYGIKLIRTTKVTPKGQVYIIEKLKEEKSLAT